MGKKDSDAAYEAFLADLKAINPKIEEIISDEKVSAKLKEGVLARSELSRQLDALRTEREAFGQEVTEARSKIQGWQKWHTDSLAERKALVDKVQAYEEQFGSMEGGNKPNYIRREDLEQYTTEQLRARETAYLKFADDLSDLKIEHRLKFKERLNTEELYKIAGEKNLPLDLAYNLYIQDRVEEQRKTELAEQLKQAREEGAREYASKHNLPVLDNRPDASVHSLDVSDAGKTQRDRVSAAVSAFQGLMKK